MTALAVGGWHHRMQELIRAGWMTRPCHADCSSRTLRSVTTVAAGRCGHGAVIVAADRASPAHTGILVTGRAVTQTAYRMIEAAAGQGHRTLREVTINTRCRQRIVAESSAPPVGLRCALHGVTTLAIAGSGNRMIE